MEDTLFFLKVKVSSDSNRAKQEFSLVQLKQIQESRNRFLRMTIYEANFSF